MALSAVEVAILLRAQDAASGVVKQVAGQLDALGGAGTKAGGGLAGVAASAARTAAAIGAIGVTGLVAGLGAAVKSATSFERQMSAVGAVAGASTADLKRLSDLALQLGKDTSFSATEAAQGLEELVKAGVSIDNIMSGGAKAALDLAAAGAVSVADAAEIASNAMNVFGLSGADMAHVADTIAGAANASAISVNDYKFSLAAAGAVAATVGVSFDDLSTAIALMGNAGIKGSDAGTSLKTMLMNLSPTSKRAKDAMRELGIVTADGANQFFTAEGKAKSLAEIAGVLQEATKHLTKEQKLMALEAMFGTDAIRAAAIMAEAGAEGFKELAGEIGKITAAEVAEKRLDNLSGSLEKLWGSLETAAITVGQAFTPALKAIVDGATNLVNAALPGLESFAGAIATTVERAGGAWQELSKVFSGENVPAINLAVLLDSLGLVGLTPAVKDVVRQAGDAWRTIGQVFAEGWEPSETVDPFVNAIGTIALVIRDTVAPAIGEFVKLITGTLVPAILAAGKWIGQHTELIGGLVAAFAAFQIISTVVGWIGGLIAAWSAASAAVTAAGGVIAAIVAVLGGPLTVAIGAVALAVGIFAAAWLGNWGGIRDTTAQVWSVLQPVLAALVDWLSTKLGQALSWLSTTGWPALVSAAEKVANWIMTTAVPALSELVTWLGEKTQAVVNWLSTTGWPALVTAGEKVRLTVETVIRFFKDLYVELDKRQVFAELGGIWETLTKTGTTLWGMILVLVDWVMKAAEWFGKLKKPLDEVNAGVGTLVGAAMLPALNALVEVLGKNAQTSIRPVELVAAAIEGAVKQVSAMLKPLSDLLALLDRLSKIQIPQLHIPQIGSDTQTLALRGGGPANPDASQQEVEAWAYQAARARGWSDADARQLVALIRGEGAGQGARAVGDHGRSFGPLQLFTGGGLGNVALAQGIDVRNPATWQQQILFGMDVIEQQGAGQWTVARQQGLLLQPPRRAAGPLDMQRIPLGGPPGRPPMDLGDEGTFTLPPWMTGDESWVQGLVQAVPAVEQAFQAVLSSVTDLGNGFTMTTTQMGTEVVATIRDASGTIVGQWSNSTQQVAQASEQMTGAVLASVTDLGNGTKMVITQSGSEVVAQIVDANGQVLNSYSSLAQQVPATVAGMSAQALTSVTALGDGTLHTLQDAAGNSIATVTDMSGRVTAQYATLANGVQLTMGDLANGVLTSTTDLGSGVMTTVQDMAGNTIVTITDMAGKVVDQYVQTAQQGGEQVAQLATATATGMGAVATAAESTSEPLQGVVADFRDVKVQGFIAQRQLEDAGKAMDEIEPPDLSPLVDGLGSVARKAEDAAKGLRKTADAARELGRIAGSGGGKATSGGKSQGETLSSVFGRAVGGPVRAGEAYVVGELGPELFIPGTSGTIAPGVVGRVELDYDRLAGRLADALARSAPHTTTYVLNGILPEEMLQAVRRQQLRDELMYRIRG